jgi:hypothetical protein
MVPMVDLQIMTMVCATVNHSILWDGITFLNDIRKMNVEHYYHVVVVGLNIIVDRFRLASWRLFQLL